MRSDKRSILLGENFINCLFCYMKCEKSSQQALKDL